MTKAIVDLPPKLVPIFTDKPGEIVRYRGSWGGRGSGKTRSFALMTAIRGYQDGMSGREGIILCAREFQNSLDESSMEEVKAAIASHKFLADYYDISERQIRSRDGRIKYAFAGLRMNVDSIKSKSRILLCWVDEAETVRETSYRKLLPTVREDNSEIWVTWNPESKDSATHLRFRADPPQYGKFVEMNWRDNPWFPDVLELERLADLEKRPDSYGHVWEGDFNLILDGAYFGRELRNARNEGRVKAVPVDRNYPVHTAMDLGKANNNPVFCFQVIGDTPKIVDFYTPETEDLRDWVRWLDSRGYNGNDYVPHDIMVTEWGSDRTRIEILRSLGRKPRRIPRVSVADGLQAGRETINVAEFDAERCAIGLHGLENYRREWDEDLKTWKPHPVKDFAEHIGSAWRYLGLSWREEVTAKAPEKPKGEAIYTARPDGSVVSNMSIRDQIEAMVKRKRGRD
jgi:phage terminase large subunit